MKAVLLDGSNESDGLSGRIRAAVETALRERGYDLEHVPLRDARVSPCMGDFLCWVRTPGTCMIDDDNRRIAAQAARADLLVFLTPVVLGGYSPLLKRMVDHLPQNCLPFFVKVHGELHHAKRYDRSPDILGIGWLPSPDPRAEAVFHRLVARNAWNLHAPHSASAVLGPQVTPEAMAATVSQCLAWPEGSPADGFAPAATAAPSSPPRKATLLVGSPRGLKSSSHALGSYLLEKAGWSGGEAKVVTLQSALSSPEKRAALEAAVDEADLVVLAFPLYVDSLPAPTVAALEHLAARRGTSAPKRFVAIANCGFPEPKQNRIALAQCELFAREAGWGWAGSLSLGGGEGMVEQKPIVRLGARAKPLRKVLDAAAHALAQGGVITPEVQAPWDKPWMPVWIYRFMGTLGWKRQARHWGARNDMYRTPYAA